MRKKIFLCFFTVAHAETAENVIPVSKLCKIYALTFKAVSMCRM